MVPQRSILTGLSAGRVATFTITFVLNIYCEKNTWKKANKITFHIKKYHNYEYYTPSW